MQRFTSCAVLLALMHSAAPANAQGAGLPTEVRLHVDGCTDSGWSPAIVRGVRLELRVEGVQRVELVEAPESEETPDTAWVLITGPCTDPNLVLTVESRTTGNSMDWQLDLSDVRQPARPRVISLAAAELLRASWPGIMAPETPNADAEEVVRDSLSRAASAEVRGALRLDPPPPSSATLVPAEVPSSSSVTPVPVEADANISDDAPPEGTSPRESAPSGEAQAPTPRTLRFVTPGLCLGASALGRIFVAEATWVTGVRTQLRWRWLEVGVEVAGGVDTHRLGRAQVIQIGLGAGVVPLSRRRGKWGGEAGLFAQVGSTRLRGVAQTEGVRTSSVEGVDARLSLRATLQYHFRYRVLLIGIDAGYSLGFEGFADGERFASTNGLSLGLSLGLGGLGR